VSEALRAPDISYEKQRHHLQASGRVSKIDFEPFVSYRCYTEWWGLGNQHHSEEGKE
jgi:hypothetical protein